MSSPDDISPDEAAAAVDAILKPLGSALRHYMPVHKAEAIKAMQGVLSAERERGAAIAEQDYTPGYGPHRDDMEALAEIQRANIAEAIRRGGR